MNIEEAKISALRSIIAGSSGFVIVVHSHPDGDALGSGTALRQYLLSKGKNASIIVPDSLPDTIKFLTDGESVIEADKSPREAQERLAACEVLFVLDMNAFSRAERFEGALRACKAESKVLIDHHLNPRTEEFDLVFSRTDISSTCELLFDILEALEGEIKNLPPKALYALMTGMTTDTNNFANSVYPGTLRMAGMLLGEGVDREDIISHLYREYSETRVRAFAALLSKKMKILPGGVACTIVRDDFKKEYPLGDGEYEGLVNIPLEIKEVKMSILLKEYDGHFRVSIRSKKGLSANRLAKKYFNGGGHEQAAGGKLFFPGDIPSADAADAYAESAVAQFLQTD